MVQPTVTGCHLVGSVPYSDAESVFRSCTAELPNRLKRIPDGETGDRHYFTLFQQAIFPKDVCTIFKSNGAVEDSGPWTPEEVDEKVAAIEKSGLETGYDVAAIASYKVFRKLKDEGVIPSHVRFQVAFPTIPNVILPFISKVFQERIAPLYEKALLKAMRNTQNSIPHEDLSIQIDIAGDTALWEATKREAKGTALEYYQPWWQGDVRDYMVAYMMRMFAEVDQDVELGIHNCYGDMDHKHWFEPPSLEVVVERGIRIYEETPHPINYFHCPVPKSATAQYGPGDNLDAYLAPLKDLVPHLEKHNTELYLGVVHEEHLELTRAMIAAAQKVVPNFGAAMECGGGRMQKDKFEDALSIAKQVSAEFT